MLNRLRTKLLITAMSLAAASAWAGPANDAAMVSLHHATLLRQGDTITGPLSSSQPMHVVVALKPRNQDQLDAYMASPGFKPLTPEQYDAQYAPTPAQAEAVADHLRRAGLVDVRIGPSRLMVEASGRADSVQAAFATRLVQVHTHDGRDAYANASDVRVPAALQGSVAAVLGMQNVHRLHTYVRTGASSGAGAVFAHNPTDFPAIYGARSLPAATSVTPGIITAGDMTAAQSHLKTFTAINGLHSVNVKLVGPGSSDTSGAPEWDLDTQAIVAMGGVRSLVLYDGVSLNDPDIYSALYLALTDRANAPPIINVSLGECENDARASGLVASDVLFQAAQVQGRTFSVSTGDFGADECFNGGTTPDYPATSPYVLAVGGTTLSAVPVLNFWTGETVWNGTGGSPSTFEPIPSWQRGVAGITNQTYRGVPDIAYDADTHSGALIVTDSSVLGWPAGVPVLAPLAGTSLASPLFVGGWARIIQAKGYNPGFAPPMLYTLAQSRFYTTAFHDITVGNNISTPGGGNGYFAAPGWDYTTGWGSLIVDQAVNHIP
ncbi:S53 family peptidase [Dyella tabacisoli]|uniref:Peptidase S53 n=1 Tax=Dyella tabacisoli TaxID=2282381 RepID=A0A369UTY0_9GAMM|nr:S53 family serine peptidase [Dyella tabacisoli]RDD83505.1 peptidase S53 [Dyella tabacisoli]